MAAEQKEGKIQEQRSKNSSQADEVTPGVLTQDGCGQDGRRRLTAVDPGWEGDVFDFF